MNFYVTMVFLDIVLVVFSLIWVALEKKRVFNFTKGFEDKKQELTEIINDAEQMIEELNKFSDYIVTQMDLKNEELSMNLRKAEEEIKHLGQKAQSVKASVPEFATVEEVKAEYKPAAVVHGTAGEAAPMSVEAKSRQAVEYAAENINFDKIVYKPVHQPSRPTAKKAEKVIPINNRYSEVLRLSESGLGEPEIAKMLNMGKGEVSLILGINKN